MILKNNLSKVLFITLISSFFLACSLTKRVPNNERLLMSNEIFVNDQAESKETLTSQLYQKPNSNILGYRLRLHLYNMAKVNPDSDRKNNLSKVLFITLISSFFLACSLTKRVPNNERLLMSNEIFVNDQAESKETLTSQLYQKPNSNILGYRLRLHLYNMAKVNPDSSYQAWLDRHPKNERFLTHLLSAKQVDRLGTSFFVSGLGRTLKDLGEAPTIYNQERTNRSLIRLKNHFFNQGYFNTKVSYQADSLQSKKINITYNVQTGKPYVYDSIAVTVHSPELDSLYKTNRRQSLLKKNDQYNATKLDEERERITSFFRNNGAYDFQKTYINYEIDTLKNTHKADIYLNIDNKNIKEGDSLRTEPFKLYKISEVNIFTSN